MRIRNYVRAESLQQAYELNQKRSARILGGMQWMRLGKGTIQTAVDLSGLGLDQIEETEDAFSIGCMVTLRKAELHEGLHVYTQGALRDALRPIVGVQFRNLATIGGSIWGRFGFSDVLTVFLALDTWVELYAGGLIPLREFAERKRDNDILVRLIVKKRAQDTAYQSMRLARTDFPLLTCAASLTEESGCAVVGARPGRAVCLELPQALCECLQGADENGRSAWEAECASYAKRLAEQIVTGSNMRGSAEYRSAMAGVLLERCFGTLRDTAGKRANCTGRAACEEPEACRERTAYEEQAVCEEQTGKGGMAE